MTAPPVDPWRRTWVEESARAVHARNPWAVPSVARFVIAFSLGYAIFSGVASAILGH